MAIVMAMVILSSSRSAKGRDGGYLDEGDDDDDGDGDGDGDGDSQCKFDGEKIFFQIFFSTLPSFLGSVEFWHFGPPLAF